MKSIRLVCVCIFLAISAVAASAQDTPETVAKKQIDAMRASDWAGFTALMHPSALAEFKSSFVPFIEAAPAGEQQNQVLKQLFGGKSVAELKELAPPAFFQTFMASFATLNPMIKQGLAGAEAEFLGHVDEGPDKTHVVFRMTVTMAEVKIQKMDVASLQKDGSEWKALLKGDMQAMIAGMLRMLKSR